MNSFTVGALLVSLLLVACQTTSPAQTGKGAEDIPGNLVRVDGSSAKLAYVDPTADFSKYTAILLSPLGVDNVEIIQPSTTVTTTGQRHWELTDADKQKLQQDFREAMTKQLSGGGYTLVDTVGDNVLQISAMVTRIAPNAPKDDFRSRPTGRNRVFSEGSGDLSVAVAFSDAETREVLALAKDTRTGSTMWGLNTSVTNAAEVRRMFTAWAMQIRAQLDRVRKKE